jgi:transposase-like protein
MRNSIKNILEKNMKAITKDLRKIYRSTSEESGKLTLANTEEKWISKFPATY